MRARAYAAAHWVMVTGAALMILGWAASAETLFTAGCVVLLVGLACAALVGEPTPEREP